MVRIGESCGIEVRVAEIEAELVPAQILAVGDSEVATPADVESKVAAAKAAIAAADGARVLALDQMAATLAAWCAPKPTRDGHGDPTPSDR